MYLHILSALVLKLSRVVVERMRAQWPLGWLFGKVAFGVRFGNVSKSKS